MKINESKLRQIIREEIISSFYGSSDTIRDEYRGWQISVWKEQQLNGAWDNELLPPDSDVMSADVDNNPNYSANDYIELIKKWIDNESQLGQIVKESVRKAIKKVLKESYNFKQDDFMMSCDNETFINNLIQDVRYMGLEKAAEKINEVWEKFSSEHSYDEMIYSKELFLDDDLYQILKDLDEYISAMWDEKFEGKDDMDDAYDTIKTCLQRVENEHSLHGDTNYSELLHKKYKLINAHGKFQ